jgi:hypothetical protein
VKTMHSLLRLNLVCMHLGHHHSIVFVNDDPFDRVEMIMKQIKITDRLVFIDYSVFIDHETIDKIFVANFEKCHCIVFPCVKEGIHWDAFKSGMDTTEPVDQIALQFDTEIGQKVGESLYKVNSTNPKCWLLDTKPALKLIREKKGEALKLPAKNSEMFQRLIEKGVKIHAYTACRLVVTYPHECLSNILESAGVKSV